MAKEPKAAEPAAGAETNGNGKGPLTKAAVAKLLTGSVTVHKLDARGQPRTEKLPDGSKRYLTETHPIGADDILDFKVRGDRVTAVTIDGQKLEARV